MVVEAWIMADAVDRVRRWMETRRTSQTELAKRLGVRQQTVSEWLTRRKIPELRQARELQRVTGIRVDSWLQVKRDVSPRAPRQPSA